MKQQVVSQKVGNRTGIGSKARTSSAQKPARRERDSSEALRSRLRRMIGYAPLVLKIVVGVGIGVLVFLGYRAAASASFFQVRKVETRGTTRASAQAIEKVVRHNLDETGVWRADLAQLNDDLERLPWVRTAIVTRVLPDGIRVRIVEREPKLVVRTAAGRFTWVDDDAVLLEDMKPTDQMPTFFLRGWNEDVSVAAAQENRERVKTFLQLQRAWEGEGLAERVSELNLLDLRDVRAQLAGDDAQIEIRLGAQDQAPRLRLALNVLDKQRQTPRGPFISYIDLSQGMKRAIIGLVTGNRAIADSESTDASTVEAVTATDKNRTQKPVSDRTAKDKETKTRTQARKADQRRT